MYFILFPGIPGLSDESINVSVKLCQQICLSTSLSIKNYIGKQSSWSFFEATRVFDPRRLSGSSAAVSHDIAVYKAIPWLKNDTDDHKLLEEWSIHVSQPQCDLKQYIQVDDNSVEHFDISRYWLDRRASLPRLAKHAFRTIDVPVTSADAERAFSRYNKLVCYRRLSLSDESVGVLHSAAWNGDITGRFEGYDH